MNTDTSDFKSLLPIGGATDKAIFGLSSNGVASNRDDWVYDVDANTLAKKTKFLSDEYNRLLKDGIDSFPNTIKWSESLKAKFMARKKSKFDHKRIVTALFRPFTKLNFYSEKVFSDRLTINHYQMFGEKLDKQNTVIVFSSGKRGAFGVSVSACLPGLDIFCPDGTQCLPFYRLDTEGGQQDNITDWGLRQFQEHYGDKKITKRDIFHYTYAVLHHPAYRAKYEINLKREFPRLPFYDDFRQWAKWGAALMELHLDYENAKLFPLKRHDRKEAQSKQPLLLPDERIRPERLLNDKPQLKPKLKADKATGQIEIDATTTLSGIPAAAWDYRLGNRSGLEWVLDQWKEHKISDPTVAEKFNTYRFAAHKEAVIALLRRVCTVSVETMKIVNAMS